TAHQPVLELSGGNQQKVQLARLMREEVDVLLADEPTRGIDVASKAQVIEVLRSLADEGKGIVFVSSQLDEVLAVCDRIVVLRRGVLDRAEPPRLRDEAALLAEVSS